MNNQEWIAKEEKHCAHNYHPLPIVLTKGQGVWLWDIEGKRYLDMMSAYSAISLGHSHPKLISVLKEQAERLCVVSRAFHADTLQPFLEKLCTVSGMDMALPMNSGAEAVETALKAARRFGYEQKSIPDNQGEIIVARDNFHGRTISIISFSTEKAYQEHFGPLTPGFVTIPFGNSEALKRAITQNTCAFLVEPIQGEAGIQIPPKGWLKECEEICRAENILFILDEIQSGLGRTGKMFAFEHEDVQPDGLILGKALGGGILPVSAFLARKEVMDVFAPGTHGSTFGGNPLAAKIGLATLGVFEDEDIVKNSFEMGNILLQALRTIKHPLIKEVRGRGLWIGVEINKPNVARAICEKMMTLGVLAKETHDTVIRFAPPLIIKENEIDFAVAQFAKALEEF
ncbi:ornithine--oxo-acid transaminase [Candidatus Berkiella aquae]|uniref:ornithine aminotransferase n=1 Tax=Candidatus Berkiella aquae TaxID=295108 RepID=A0A0Q9YJZ0_9GAMM|nr:ornithine--oxo-acid transaminase [Candidatus Berkiella aquae]MCS5710064.1 ornithine--oxo-acid transaminase [Candidatus Berkiella aquae]